MMDLYYEKCYIGLPLPSSFLDVYTKTQSYLEKKLPYLSLEKPIQAHITLYFLGNLMPDHINKIDEIIKNDIEQSLPDEVTFTRLKCFDDNDPRTLYFEVTNCDWLYKLNDKLAVSLRKFNFQERKFTPHLTVARLKNPDTVEFYNRNKDGILAFMDVYDQSCKIDEIQLRGRIPESKEMIILKKYNITAK